MDNHEESIIVQVHDLSKKEVLKKNGKIEKLVAKRKNKLINILQEDRFLPRPISKILEHVKMLPLQK